MAVEWMGVGMNPPISAMGSTMNLDADTPL